LTFNGLIVSVGAFVENIFSPKGCKEPPYMLKILKCLDATVYTMVLTISSCKFDATKTPQMHFNTFPTCFEGHRDGKIRFNGAGK